MADLSGPEKVNELGLKTENITPEETLSGEDDDYDTKIKAFCRSHKCLHAILNEEDDPELCFWSRVFFPIRDSSEDNYEESSDDEFLPLETPKTEIKDDNLDQSSSEEDSSEDIIARTIKDVFGSEEDDDELVVISPTNTANLEEDSKISNGIIDDNSRKRKRSLITITPEEDSAKLKKQSEKSPNSPPKKALTVAQKYAVVPFKKRKIHPEWL